MVVGQALAGDGGLQGFGLQRERAADPDAFQAGAADEGDDGIDAHHTDDDAGYDVKDVQPLKGSDSVHLIFYRIKSDASGAHAA